MSFTESFEVYAKARLRQIIAELTIDGSARRLVDYSTMLLDIEKRGIRDAIVHDPMYGDGIGELWRYVAEGYFSEEYRVSRFSIRTVEGNFTIEGVIVRGTGLAYNQNQGTKRWYITHLKSGDNTGNTLETEKDAQLYIRAMVDVATKNKFTWNWDIEKLRTSKVLSKETMAKIHSTFEALKAEKQTA